MHFYILSRNIQYHQVNQWIILCLRPHVHSYNVHIYCAVEDRCGFFPFDEANWLVRPGNIRATVPTSGYVVISHRGSLWELGNEGTGWWMPSRPTPPTLPHQVVLELSLSPGQEVGWSTNTSTHVHARMDKLHLHMHQHWVSHAQNYVCTQKPRIYVSVNMSSRVNMMEQPPQDIHVCLSNNLSWLNTAKETHLHFLLF